VTGEWIKLHNEDFHDLLLFAKYNENDRVKDFAMGKHTTRMGIDK
jgi:hypothetical protein